MSIDVALSHVTNYFYDRYVNLGPQTIRLRPAPHSKAHVLSYSLKVSPDKHFLNWQQDPFSNYQAVVNFPDKVKFLKIEVDLIAKINVFNPFDFFLEESAKSFPFDYSDQLKDDLVPYLVVSESAPQFIKFTQSVSPSLHEDLINCLVAINQAINNEIKYNVRMQPGVQTPAETLALKSGSCRDLAWLGCQTFRTLGLASRFCSGYLVQLKPDVKPMSGPEGPKQDFIDLHAWVEVYLPGAGWVGLDPSSGLFAGEGHIPLSCTPSPSSAAPISGLLEPCETEFEFDMNVKRLDEAPRSTKPYSKRQWEKIQAAGRKVDLMADSLGLELTMGGEPTFVSIAHQNLDEWQTKATGPHKEALGKNVLMALKEKFSQGGLIHHAQGKWYPGESLPRWAYACYWRKDGQNICGSNHIILNQEKHSHHLEKETAKTFLVELCKKLHLPEKYILPAYEDIPYYIWKKQFSNASKVTKEENEFNFSEKEIMDAVLTKQNLLPMGYVVPLGFSSKQHTWISCPWEFESRILFLIPGSSPIGLRLPINQLPSVPQADDELFQSRSFADMSSALPTRESLLHRYSKNLSHPYDYPNGFIKTALCAEIRDNILHVFIPPINLIEDYLALIAVIEETCTQLKIDVILEGYPPPHDIRIEYLKITPDPGVLEVNIQPASSWQALTNNIQIIYQEAKQHDLEAEKFMLDGKKVGTGGGNHIVLGASTPLDSPFLKRPDLLQSMITFWQNHPSLSYLFSSMFIGPTSQSPRIDEARHDSLYEMEIAFKQIASSENIPFWQIDRLFRNLLVDVTGNTHRSEFCIDKLYSPSGESGRLGLLELRAFEMPPHYQMCSLQYLLIKSLITIFWKTPYRSKLRRFGSKLHDKYMLPVYLQDDFKAVINFIYKSGINLEFDWFLPFIEFRFQKYGTVQIENLEIELRAALEPWPVMGEAVSSSGMSRAVDSSLERVQVTVKGMLSPDQLVCCNGHVLPLKKYKGDDEQHVCGVRFKAWALNNALHPNLPVHAPLIFDVYDYRHERSVGGFKYHVFHPGGRNYDTYPINENEAQGRRLSRFEKMSHSIDRHFNLKGYVTGEEYSHTLDLRHTT